MRISLILAFVLTCTTALRAQEWVFAPPNTYGVGSAAMAAIETHGVMFGLACRGSDYVILFIPLESIKDKIGRAKLAMGVDEQDLVFHEGAIDPWMGLAIARAAVPREQLVAVGGAKTRISVHLLNETHALGMMSWPTTGAAEAIETLLEECD